MTTNPTQPVPNDLREQMIGLIANAPEDELPELHRRLLIAERDRLWKEVQQDAQETYEKGGFAAVPELIRDYRNRNRPE